MPGWPTEVPQGPDARPDASSHEPGARAHRLSYRRDACAHHRRRRAGGRCRGLPGPCARLRRLRPPAGRAGALCQRLSLDRTRRARRRRAMPGPRPGWTSSAGWASIRPTAPARARPMCARRWDLDYWSAAPVRGIWSGAGQRDAWRWRSGSRSPRPSNNNSPAIATPQQREPYSRTIHRKQPMTYCVALCLEDGLVMLADTRTNAGVDNISSFRQAAPVRGGRASGSSPSCRPAISPSRSR